MGDFAREPEIFAIFAIRNALDTRRLHSMSVHVNTYPYVGFWMLGGVCKHTLFLRSCGRFANVTQDVPGSVGDVVRFEC